MAKKQSFGEQAQEQKGPERRMAKVIISTKTDKNNYAFKEAMVDQDNVRDFIKESRG